MITMQLGLGPEKNFIVANVYVIVTSIKPVAWFLFGVQVDLTEASDINTKAYVLYVHFSYISILCTINFSDWC